MYALQDIDGPLKHLAIPFREEHARDYTQIRFSQSVSQQSFGRQVFRPHNIYEFKPRPKFIPPTRYVHTAIVLQTAFDIAYELGLNCYVTEAAAVGHDAGHLAKGHFEEQWISQKAGRPFKHEYYSLVRLEDIEGITLTPEVRQAIALHSFDSGVMERTDVFEETRCVAVSDKIAYLALDTYTILDFLELGGNEVIGSTREAKHLFQEIEARWSEVYPGYHWGDRKVIGQAGMDALHWDAIHYLVDGVIKESIETGRVAFSKSPVAQRLLEYRKMLYARFYPRIDDAAMESRELELAYKFFVEHYPEYPTLLMLTLPDDVQIFNIALAMEKGDPGDLWDAGFDVQDALRNCKVPKTSEREIDMFRVPEGIKLST